MRIVPSPASAARSIFDRATTGSRLLTLSSAAPTNIAVPARAVAAPVSATMNTRNAVPTSCRTAGTIARSAGSENRSKRPAFPEDRREARGPDDQRRAERQPEEDRHHHPEAAVVQRVPVDPPLHEVARGEHQHDESQRRQGRARQNV